MGLALPMRRPQSLVAKALAYGPGHWDALARYLEDGRFEIDNNPHHEIVVKDTLRPVNLVA